MFLPEATHGGPGFEARRRFPARDRGAPARRAVRRPAGRRGPPPRPRRRVQPERPAGSLPARADRRRLDGGRGARAARDRSDGRAAAHDHCAQRFARHLVRPVDQPLSRLRARLLLLLRAADPRLSGAVGRARLREPAVRQGRRGGAARTRTRQPEIQAEGDCARRQHRRLSADRTPVPGHPRRARSAGEGAPPGRHRHQIEPGAARPRPARADGGRRPGQASWPRRSSRRSTTARSRRS